MRNKPYPLHQVESVPDLRELVIRGARLFGDKTAYTYVRDGERVDVTFRQFDHDVRALGTALLQQRRPGEKVAVIGENSYEWILVCMATMNAGLVIVPIDKESTAADALTLIRRSGASSVAYADRLGEQLSPILQTTTGIAFGTDVPALVAQGEAALAAGDHAFADVVIDPRALAALFFTSGTTGVPKGVMLSHENFAADVCAAWRYIDMEGPTMLVLPLHHTFALNTSILCSLHRGFACIINSGLPRLSAEIVEFSPDSMYVVPLFIETFHRQIWTKIRRQGKETMVKRMIKVVEVLGRLGIDIRRKVFREILDGMGGRLSLMITGGAPVDFDILRDLRAFGITMINGYGITECAPIVAENRNFYFRDGSAGLPLECNQVMIAHPDADGVGEIRVKGTNVMLGYYEDDEATAAVMEDGWFSTGDLGRLDADGFLYITGRLKNLIITANGENVSAEELEQLVGKLPLVEEVIVSDRNGTITADVFPDATAAAGMSPDQVLAALKDGVKQLNQTLPAFKRIKDVTLREVEFEKTTTRKIKR